MSVAKVMERKEVRELPCAFDLAGLLPGPKPVAVNGAIGEIARTNAAICEIGNGGGTADR